MDRFLKKEKQLTHAKLKDTGWEEWLDMNNSNQFTHNQKTIIRSAYEYGWYNAYGLKTEDKNHKEMMKALKNLPFPPYD